MAALVLVNSFLLSVKWEQEESSPEGSETSSGSDEGTNSEVSDAGSVRIWRNGLSNASSALTICFVIEVIMKLIAFTPSGFWQSYR